LIINLEDTLITEEWDSMNGSRQIKRPGVDKLLMYLSNLYEIYIITKLDLNSTSNNILPAYKEVNGKNEFEYQETKLTDAQGKASFTNLTSGCYEIKETKTPSGYIKEEDVCIYVKVVDGVALYLQKSDDTTVTIGNWTAISQTSNTDLIHLETLGIADDPSTPEDDPVPTALSVGNTPGAELPHTGGPGTGLFTLLGILFMALAGAGMIVMKKQTRFTV